MAVIWQSWRVFFSLRTSRETRAISYSKCYCLGVREGVDSSPLPTSRTQKSLHLIRKIKPKLGFTELSVKVSIWPVGFLQFWIVSDAYITLPNFFFLFWPDFPVKTRFKFPAGATPFKIGRLIKSKRVLGLAGRDVKTGKKNFYNSLNKRRFLFRKDVEVDFSLGKHDSTQ